jgi:Tol biopolymer transport system component
MTDQRVDARMDALLHRLDFEAEPDPAFVDESLTMLLPHVGRARARDRRALGRLLRDLQAVAAGRPIVSTNARQTLAIGLAVVILLLLATTVLILVGSRRQLPPPFGPAANGHIAFVAENHVFLADPDGSNRRQISFEPGRQANPVFSRDGTRLAWQRYGTGPDAAERGTADVLVADADGSRQRVIAANVSGLSHIAWSPDGTLIAFSGSVDGGRSGAMIAPSDGSAPPSVFMTADSPWDPTWSPDGTRLAVGTSRGLVVVNRDGSDPVVVTRSRFAEVGERSEIADWSPDGTMLLFTAFTGDPSIPPPEPYVPYTQEVYVVALDGTPERLLSADSERSRDAVWSPDGTRIAYMRAGSGSGPNVWITDASGGQARVLPGDFGWYQPIWSPDGTKVVVTDDTPGPSDLAGPAVRVILDVAGTDAPIVIPAAGVAPYDPPDWAASWQRVTP